MSSQFRRAPPHLKLHALSWDSEARDPECQATPVWGVLRSGHYSGVMVSLDFGIGWSWS